MDADTNVDYRDHLTVNGGDFNYDNVVAQDLVLGIIRKKSKYIGGKNSTIAIEYI